MKIILITHPTRLIGEWNVVLELFERGLDTLHIRKPGYSEEDIANILNRLPKDLRPQIVLHGYPEIALKYKLKGLHHNSTTNFIPNFGISQSKSFHSIKEVLSCKEPYSYGLISPVFDSISKLDYLSHFSADDLKHLNSKTKLPLVALGGITSNSIQEVHDMGFKKIAVLGTIWEQIIHERLYMVFDSLRLNSKKFK